MLLIPLPRRLSFNTPRGNVHTTASALYVIGSPFVREFVV